jgi:hypothetical protein
MTLGERAFPLLFINAKHMAMWDDNYDVKETELSFFNNTYLLTTSEMC